MSWWEDLPGRFVEELEKMEEFTNSELRVMDGSQLPGVSGAGVFMVWHEIITSNSGKKYELLMVCRRNHPYSAPIAWILEPKVKHHHMLADGRLCLHDPHIGPDETWVLNIRNWACEWVHYFETGNWPKDYASGR